MLDYLCGSNVITRVLVTGRQKLQNQEKKKKKKKKTEGMNGGFEEGGRGHEPKNTGVL